MKSAKSEKYYRVTNQWDDLKETKRPTQCTEVITINEWNNTNPKKHLWIKWRGYNFEFITDSNSILQLAEIIKKIQKKGDK